MVTVDLGNENIYVRKLQFVINDLTLTKTRVNFAGSPEAIKNIERLGHGEISFELPERADVGWAMTLPAAVKYVADDDDVVHIMPKAGIDETVIDVQELHHLLIDLVNDGYGRERLSLYDPTTGRKKVVVVEKLLIEILAEHMLSM